MATTNKFQGVCSVCLRPMQLHGDKPIRHGFSAIGVRHGANSGYHTGPCDGTRFPHLGISTEGTVWALGNARKHLTNIHEAITRLEAFPDLTWYPTLYNVRGRPPDLKNPVVLKHDAPEGWSNDGRPSYMGEHRRKMSSLVNTRDELERAIAAYEKVLATWKPTAATAAAAKVTTTHLAIPHTMFRGTPLIWSGIACRRTRPGNAMVKTEDSTKVTCTRCRTRLGLPAQ